MKPLQNTLVFGLLLGMVGSAQATSMEQWDTPRLTKESKWIQIGSITSSWSSWDPEKKMIFTYVKMRVDQTVKGDARQEVLIRQAGGQSGKVGMVVHGVARFAPGEKALVFLHEDPDGAPSLVGMAQGKYKIYKNLANGEDMAFFRTPSNVEFFTKGDEGQVRHLVTSPTERRVPLRMLLQEVRSAMQAEEPMSH